MVVPPQISVTFTLLAQQLNYWVTPYMGAATAVPSTSSGIAAGPGSVPSSVYAQQQGSPNLQSFQATPQPTPVQTTSIGGSTPTPSSSGFIMEGSLFSILVLVVVAVVAVVAVSLVLILKSKRKNL